MKWVPFTVHIRVVPEEGKRFVYIRSLQKYAASLYAELSTNANLNLPRPGGGAHESHSGYDHSAISQHVSATAYKPQFGDTPAQLMLTGFYYSTNENNSPNSDINILSANQSNIGSLAAPNQNMPTAQCNAEVTALKSIIDSAIAAVLPLRSKTLRLDYNGIVFGNRGYHFPS